MSSLAEFRTVVALWLGHVCPELNAGNGLQCQRVNQYHGAVEPGPGVCYGRNMKEVSDMKTFLCIGSGPGIS